MSQAEELRAKLEKVFSPETAYPGSWDATRPAKGHCAVVALAVQKLVGGKLASVMMGTSHWFNHAVQLETGHLVDIDFTGDQFGYPKVHIAKAGELYWKFKERQLTEISEETMKRFELFWSKLQGSQ